MIQWHLIEFAYKKQKSKSPIWGGALINGILVGENIMGNILMKIRDSYI
jgi:hypothetical protein